jgi:hypothetical protein
MLTKEYSKQDDLSIIGEVFKKWSFAEYDKHQRGKKWYVGFFIIALALLAIALYTANFFFVVIIILFVTITFLHDVREPETVDFYIGANGIAVGNKVFRYKELNDFWIIYELPHVKNLYFHVKSFVHPRLSIPLYDEDPLAIRDFLLKRLTENLTEEHEPFSEQIGRILKI